MDRKNIGWVFGNFLMVEGTLCLKLAVGSRPTSYLRDGVAWVVFKGKEYRAEKLAWVLQTYMWPEYPLGVADGNVLNLALDNLLPITGRNFRVSVTAAPDGAWRHNLDHYGRFASQDAARADWYKCRAAYFRPGVSSIIRRDRETAHACGNDRIVETLNIAAEGRHRLRTDNKLRISRPTPVSGKRWHFYEDRWTLTWEPVHWLDDYIVRCHAIKYLRAHSARFDETLGRVVIDVAATPQMVAAHRELCAHAFCKAATYNSVQPALGQTGKIVKVYDTHEV